MVEQLNQSEGARELFVAAMVAAARNIVDQTDWSEPRDWAVPPYAGGQTIYQRTTALIPALTEGLAGEYVEFEAWLRGSAFTSDEATDIKNRLIGVWSDSEYFVDGKQDLSRVKIVLTEIMLRRMLVGFSAEDLEKLHPALTELFGNDPFAELSSRPELEAALHRGQADGAKVSGLTPDTIVREDFVTNLRQSLWDSTRAAASASPIG